VRGGVERRGVGGSIHAEVRFHPCGRKNMVGGEEETYGKYVEIEYG
jgi:hypothetical protein